MPNIRQEMAVWMAKLGFEVFLIKPNSKKPHYGSSWHAHRTSDIERIEGWFSNPDTADSNYAAYPGENYAVIDLDYKPSEGKNGVAVFENICAENDIEDFRKDFNTFVVQTPSGGYHVYFKAPFPCGNANDFPDGIDVRGYSGYVVAPGSSDERGGWDILEASDTSTDDPDLIFADFPDFLIQFMRAPGRKDPNAGVPLIDLDLEQNVEHARKWLDDHEPAIQGQNGNDHTYETAQFMRDFGLSEEMTLKVMLESGWNAKCDPPWDGSELEFVVGNAYRYGLGRPGNKAPTYKIERLENARPSGGWGLTEEVVAEMFHSTQHLSLVIDNDVDDDVPAPVVDDGIDVVLGEIVDDEPFWYTMDQFLTRGKVREYVIYEWMVSHGICHIIASRGTGKSAIALDLSFHLVFDQDWWGIPIKKGYKVIYICGEDDEGLELNANAWMTHHGKDPSEHAERLRDRFLVASDIIKMNNSAHLKLRIKEMLEWTKGEPCIIVLDTWQRATSGSSKNDSESMENAIENAEAVARHLNGPMLSCAHPPKDGRMTVIGAGVQEDTSTGIWFLEGTAERLTLTVNRVKGGGKGNKLYFELLKTELEGEDSFGKAHTGVVINSIGGTEQESHLAEQNKKDRDLRTWARAIYGVHSITSDERNNMKPVNMKKRPVSDFLEEMFRAKSDESHAMHFIADEFFLKYGGDLSTLLTFKRNEMEGDKDDVFKTKWIENQLNELFPQKRVAPAVTFDNGSKIMNYEPPEGGKQKLFSFTKNEIEKD